MKFIFCLVIFSLWFSPQQDAKIKEIRNEYSEIHKNLKKLKVDSLELEDVSTEGGLAIFYSDKSNQIRLIKTELYFESGKSFEEFYYKNDSLFFNFSQTLKYNVPMNVDSALAIEIGSEPFDPNKTDIFEDRFYFSGNLLFHWIGPDHKTVDKMHYNEKEKEILDFSNNLLKLFKHKI